MKLPDQRKIELGKEYRYRNIYKGKVLLFGFDTKENKFYIWFENECKLFKTFTRAENYAGELIKKYNLK